MIDHEARAIEAERQRDEALARVAELEPLAELARKIGKAVLLVRSAAKSELRRGERISIEEHAARTKRYCELIDQAAALTTKPRKDAP